MNQGSNLILELYSILIYKKKASKQYENISFREVTILTTEIDRIFFYRQRKTNQCSTSTLHL